MVGMMGPSQGTLIVVGSFIIVITLSYLLYVSIYPMMQGWSWCVICEKGAGGIICRDVGLSLSSLVCQNINVGTHCWGHRNADGVTDCSDPNSKYQLVY